MTGPSWTAPTVELRPAYRRRPAPPGNATAGRPPGADRRRAARTVAWLREYAWLLAAGGVAVVVLLCARALVGGAAPTWVAGVPVAARPVVTTAPEPAAAVATRTHAELPTTRARGPSSPARTPGPTASPVLLGPGGEWELWLLLRRYCDEVHGAREAQVRSGLSPAENNWECRGRGRSVAIDMTAACRHAYGAGTFARYGDADNALSWRCYR
jgi:hypothetical protein